MLLLTGCPHTEPCAVFGDLTQPPSLTVIQRMPDGGVEDVRDALLLQVPPQGGHVAYVGVRVTNFERCRIDLSASVFVLDGGALEAEEKRRVELGDGGASDPADPANFANVPVCPNYGALDVVGPRWRLVVEAAQRDGRSVKAELPVVFSCDAGGADCACECAKGYELGKCGRDAG